MLHIALLYFVLCIIAIRPILCDNIPIPPELISDLDRKVHRKGRRLFIQEYCQQQEIVAIECVTDHIKTVAQPVPSDQLNWAMWKLDEKTGEKSKRIMDGCHKSCFAELGINTKGANYRLTESDTKNYELCRSDCILDKVYTSKKQSKKVHTPEEQPQRVRKRSRRGRQYGR